MMSMMIGEMMIGNYLILIKYTEKAPMTPPKIVDIWKGSLKKYIENKIAVKGTRKIYELAFLGPSLVEA